MWILAMLGCEHAPTEAVWAFDPTWVEPRADGIYGFETWNLYDARWEQKRSERAFVCSVVVSVEGARITPDCPGCTEGWAVTPTFLESDCDEDVSGDPGFLSLRALALGPVTITETDPWPGQSMGAQADYGDGWVPYGWAYPDALDLGETVDDPTWDGERAFQFWPAFVWDLQAG